MSENTVQTEMAPADVNRNAGKMLSVNNVIEMKNITKSYVMGEQVVHALRGVDLVIKRSDYVAIMGPSGICSIHCLIIELD